MKDQKYVLNNKRVVLIGAKSLWTARIWCYADTGLRKREHKKYYYCYYCTVLHSFLNFKGFEVL